MPFWRPGVPSTIRISRSSASSRSCRCARRAAGAAAARPSRKRPCGPSSGSAAERVQMAPAPFRCGAIALIGRPNVGKSTLQNALLGQKISITSRKPQTTRRPLRGVLTTDAAQFILVDTPGFQTQHRGALNRAMNRTVRSTLDAVDVVALVVEAGRFGAEDRTVLRLAPPGTALFLVVNKTDAIEAARLPAWLQIGRAHV